MSATAPAKSDCVDFLSLLEEPKRRQVLAGSMRVTSPAGSTAFVPDELDYAAVINSGLVRVYAGDEGGRQATAFYRHRGELLTIGLVRRPAIDLYVQAVTDAELTSLDVNLLRTFMDRDLDVSRALLINYSTLLAHSTWIIAVRSLGDITVRLAFDLLDRACANQLLSGKLVVRASQQQMADSIGSVREVVARSLRKLRQDGIIATAPNLVRVQDIERLEEVATQLSAN
jgi:CRP/FNR family cyclic AMP-dependent transcriptional regulator